MKALVIEKPGSLKIMEVPKPTINSPEEVVVKVEACGICGTDIHLFHGLDFARYPIIPGHEFVGIITELGEKAKGSFKEGERVVVDPNLPCFYCEACRRGEINQCKNVINQGVNKNGAYAEYVSVNMKQCYTIPSELSNEVAVLGEPMSCVLHGIDRAEITPDEQVLILGAGPIGTLMYKYLHNIIGVSNIDVIEISKERIIAAKEAGVESISDSNRDTTYDVVFEASGSQDAFENGIKLLKPRGRFIQFGVANESTLINLSPYEIYRKELNILGSFINPFTMSRALKILIDHQDKFKGIVSKSITLEEAEEILEGKISTKSILKVMIHF